MTDQQIERLAAGLRQSVEAPGLWERIETTLRREKESRALEERMTPVRKTWRLPVLAAAVAAVFFLVLLPPAVFLKADRPLSPILGKEEVASLTDELEGVEREIERIEPLFRRKAASSGGDAATVRGQIEFIDSNIETCRSLAGGNGLNRGINRSLLDCTTKRLEIMRRYLSR